jgi:hypothetical protein
MKRPTFFISSTIYDFVDLRSALKYFLEAHGCRVLASECNDFPVDRNVHSYQACLRAIEEADYFILLVGSRVGGWFDERQRVSITQSEYRRARELQDEGSLKLINFVRGDVWTIREDRRQLAKYLRSLPIPEAVATSIVSRPGKFAEDAQFIADFLSEVSRNAETKAAASGDKPLPTGNWIHVFNSFKDITDVLISHLFLSTSLEELALRSVVRLELRDLLAQCLLKVKGAVVSPRGVIDTFHQSNPVSMPDRAKSTTVIDTPLWQRLSSYSIHLLGRVLQAPVLDKAIASPVFLKFDREGERYETTPVFSALVKLREEVTAFNRACNTENLSVVFGNSKRARPDVGAAIDIPTAQLVGLLHPFDRWANVVALCESLVLHFEGGQFKVPTLRPDSPIVGMPSELEAERVNSKDLTVYLDGLPGAKRR